MTCLAILTGLLFVFASSVDGKLGLKDKKKMAPCRDLRGDCNTFKNWNWCITRPSTMKRICRMSCDMCGEKKCKDLRSDCHYLSSLGWCKSKRRSMAQICPVTCKLCPRKGPKKPPKTASVKTPIDVTTVPKIAPSTTSVTTSLKSEVSSEQPRYTTSAEQSDTCVDRRADCRVFATMGWCSSRQEGMKTFCASTCKLCLPVQVQQIEATTATKQRTTKTTPTTVVTTERTTTKKKTTPRETKTEEDPECQNTRSDCNYLQSIGFCITRRSSMTRMCPRACQFCSSKDAQKFLKRKDPPRTTRTPSTVRYVTSRKSVLCTDNYGTPRCEYYKYLGWCDKDDNVARNCFKTCKCGHSSSNSLCHLSPFGCCWDQRSPKLNKDGLGCPKCVDDPRFLVLCDRFSAACHTPGGLGDSVRLYCPRMCGFCYA